MPHKEDRTLDYVERRMAVFRTGEHTDSAGRLRTWTPEDLQRIATSYDPEHHEAPIVVGHPQDNTPAYGWVKGIDVDKEGTMWANTDLLPEFDELVQKGVYKKRSVSFYPDLGLRHIGFLGGQPPAVKGLPDVAFGDAGGVEIELEAGTKPGDITHKEGTRMPVTVKDLFTKFKEALKGSGVEITDLETPISYTEEETRAMVKTAVDAEVAKKAAEFAEREAELKKRADALAEIESGVVKKTIADFIEEAQKAGKMSPAMVKAGMGLQAFMEQAATLAPIEFTEGEVKKAQGALEFMQAFLAAMPKVVDFSGKGQNGEDLAGAELRDKMLQDYREANKCTLEVAVEALAKDKPELFNI